MKRIKKILLGLMVACMVVLSVAMVGCGGTTKTKLGTYGRMDLNTSADEYGPQLLFTHGQILTIYDDGTYEVLDTFGCFYSSTVDSGVHYATMNCTPVLYTGTYEVVYEDTELGTMDIAILTCDQEKANVTSGFEVSLTKETMSMDKLIKGIGMNGTAAGEVEE